ncbi:MAG: hypothetical protein ACXWK0_14690, partial [Caulobacteraceae bacterium]
MKFYVLAGAIGAVGVLVAEGPAGAAELLQNGGFEQPYLGPFNWAYPGSTSYPGNPPEFIPIPTATLDSWTYDGSALVNGQVGSDWYGPVPPVGFGGLQFAALQMQSTISQDFASPGGNLTLSWLAGGRPADPNGTYFGDQSYLVELDGTTVGSFSTVSGEV